MEADGVMAAATAVSLLCERNELEPEGVRGGVASLDFQDGQMRLPVTYSHSQRHKISWSIVCVRARVHVCACAVCAFVGLYVRQ